MRLTESFRPISLKSFLLKTMKKVLDNYIRKDTIAQMPTCIQGRQIDGDCFVSDHFVLSMIIKKQ